MEHREYNPIVHPHTTCDAAPLFVKNKERQTPQRAEAIVDAQEIEPCHTKKKNMVIMKPILFVEFSFLSVQSANHQGHPLAIAEDNPAKAFVPALKDEEGIASNGACRPAVYDGELLRVVNVCDDQGKHAYRGRGTQQVGFQHFHRSGLGRRALLHRLH